ncbi:MAG: TolC family protein [Planctomycetes bacterium]|nr:TolC family protein [Planctomycetota bacterium]
MRNPRSSTGLARSVESALAALCIVLGGCRSPVADVAGADREAYEILNARRADLGATTHFSIDPPPNALRVRLEQGEVLAPIDLVSSLTIASENSRDYRRRMEDLYLAALDLTLERFRFAVQRDGTFSTLFKGNADGLTEASSGFGAGLARVLGTGASIVGDFGLSLARSLTGSSSDGITSDLSLSITQPLLRGFGERIVLEPLTQSERNVVYEVRDFERFRRTFAVDVASRYFDILQQADTVANERVNMENLVVLRQRNEELALAGRLSDIQVDQALQDELRSRNRLIQAEERLDALFDDFKFFLGLPIDAKIQLDPDELTGLEVDETLDIDEALAIDHALRYRLDLQTSFDQSDDSARRVEVARDNLLANVDITSRASATSDVNDPLKYSKDNLSWNLGLDIDLPFDRVAERNAYRESLITLERSRRTATQLADQIRSDLRDSLRQAKNRLETFRIQQGAVQLAERRVESTTLNLQAGRADTRDILEAQEALLEARNALTAARIDYHISQLALWRDMELLRVDESGIRMEREALHAPTRTEP